MNGLNIKIFFKTLIIVFFLLTTACTGLRPWTKEEKGLLLWSSMASMADMYTTCRALDDPANWEINPILGRHPENEQVVIYMSFSQIATVTIAHFWPDIRKTLLIGKATINTGFAIHNDNLIKTERGF